MLRCRRISLFPADDISANMIQKEITRARWVEMCFAVVWQNGMALGHVDVEARTPELCLAAVQQNGMALEIVGAGMQTSEICVAAVQQDKRAIRFVDAQYTRKSTVQQIERILIDYRYPGPLTGSAPQPHGDADSAICGDAGGALHEIARRRIFVRIGTQFGPRVLPQL